MSLDLTEFDTMQRDEIIHVLLDKGYEEISGGDRDTLVLARPGENVAISLTDSVERAVAFAAMCREQAHNPYFPDVYDMHRTNGDPHFLLIESERLQTLENIPEDKRSVLGGFARALATVLQGHDSHDSAHQNMLKDKNVAEAALAIISKIEDFQKQDSGKFIYHDSGYNEEKDGSIEDWHPDDILFRLLKNGSWQPVFCMPFREVIVKNEEQRGALRQDTKILRDHVESLMPKKEDPAVAPQGLRFTR